MQKRLNEKRFKYDWTKGVKREGLFCEKREVRAIVDCLDFYTIRLTITKDDYKTFLVNRIRLSRCWIIYHNELKNFQVDDYYKE